MIAKPTQRNILNGPETGPRRSGCATRPPKAIHEALFIETCDGCGDCIEVCETGVLVPDSNRRPVLDFRKAECTFCGACARACPTLAFEVAQSRDWTVAARIGDDCLNASEIVCRACLESCEQTAIRFTSRTGGSFVPFVVHEMCNGCGACVSVCPEKTISAEAAS